MLVGGVERRRRRPKRWHPAVLPGISTAALQRWQHDVRALGSGPRLEWLRSGRREERMMGDWTETLIAVGWGRRRRRRRPPASARQADAKWSCGFLRVWRVSFSSAGFSSLANIGPLECCSWATSAAYKNFAGRVYGLVEEPAPPATWTKSNRSLR